MGTYTQILYQIVFGTKRHEMTLQKSGRETFYKYVSGIIKNKNCHLYQINGISNHTHICTHLHPSVALADLVKDIKVASSIFIRESKLFPLFEGWQEGYSAFTYSIEAKENLIRYIQNQENHHSRKKFKDELIELYKEHGVEFDERYLH
jgi:putative transposase